MAEEDENVKKPKKGNFVTIKDSKGTKTMIHGSIEGFTIKKARKMGFTKKPGKPSAVVGLDSSWSNKKILCILLEKTEDENKDG